MPELSVQGVTYRYPGSDTDVLQGLNFAAQVGSSWCLTGPNGAGKTTLLEICAGLRHPIAGEVLVDGERVTAANVAYLPAEPPIFPELTAAEHGAVISELWGLKGSARAGFDERFSRLLVDLNLADRIERLDSFSQGMKERVAFSLTIARPAAMVLLDEPFSHLDDRSFSACVRILRNEASVRICLIATHNMELISALQANRIQLDSGVVA